MLVFHSNIIFALALIVLALAILAFGIFLMVWFKKNPEHSKKPCRVAVYSVIILSIIALLYTGYYSAEHWFFGSGRHGKKYRKMKRVDSKNLLRFKWRDKDGNMSGFK